MTETRNPRSAGDATGAQNESTDSNRTRIRPGTPIHLLWGMEGDPEQEDRYAGVTGDGQVLVLDWESDDRPARAVRLPRVPRMTSPREEEWLALLLAEQYLARARMHADLADIIATMICAGQRRGYAEQDREYLTYRVTPRKDWYGNMVQDSMAWTITKPWKWVRRSTPRLPKCLRGRAPATFALRGTDARTKAETKIPTTAWGKLEAGATHRTGSAYAISLRTANLVCIDLDVKGGVGGPGAWETWLDDEGLLDPAYPGAMRDTTHVVTASGGEHLIYRQRPDHPIRSCDSVLPGVDVKGGYDDASGKPVGQGMAVGPGSRVLVDDHGAWGEYLLEGPFAPRFMPSDMAIALEKLIEDKRPAHAPVDVSAYPSVDPDHLPRWAWDALAGMADEIIASAPGTRHDVVNRVVFTAALRGIDPGQIEAVAMRAMSSAGITDHEQDVVGAIADGIAVREEES